MDSFYTFVSLTLASMAGICFVSGAAILLCGRS